MTDANATAPNRRPAQAARTPKIDRDDLAGDSHAKQTAAFQKDLREGLSSSPKWIPAKWLYDDRGSELFDHITRLDEYYPTRVEAEIFNAALPEIAKKVGPRVELIEPGAGNGEKAAKVLNALDDPAAVVPFDISSDYVARSGERLRERFPDLEIRPIVGDFFNPPDLPAHDADTNARMVFFPGSTIGNMERPFRHKLLSGFAKLAGHDGFVLLGLDLRKDRETLEAAYDDREGVTRQFTANILTRASREAGADFNLDNYTAYATWNDADSRVELGVQPAADQAVTIGSQSFEIAAGERIKTEHSYKFEIDRFLKEEAEPASLAEVERWTDPKGWYAVLLLRHT